MKGKKDVVYLISKTGAIRLRTSPNKEAISLIDSLGRCGFNKCSRSQFRKIRKKQQSDEAKQERRMLREEGY